MSHEVPVPEATDTWKRSVKRGGRAHYGHLQQINYKLFLSLINVWWIWHIFIRPHSNCKKCVKSNERWPTVTKFNSEHIWTILAASLPPKEWHKLIPKPFLSNWFFISSTPPPLQRDRFSCVQDRLRFSFNVQTAKRRSHFDIMVERRGCLVNDKFLSVWGYRGKWELHNYIDVREPHRAGASVIGSILRRFYGPPR